VVVTEQATLQGRPRLLQVVIGNYPEGQAEELAAVNNVAGLVDSYAKIEKAAQQPKGQRQEAQTQKKE
jgi:hypothetical protein